MIQETKRLAVSVPIHASGYQDDKLLRAALRHARHELAIAALEQMYNGRQYNVRITEKPPTREEMLMYERGYSTDPPRFLMELELTQAEIKWVEFRSSFRQSELEYIPQPRPGFVERVKRGVRWKMYEWRVARRRRREESK